MNKSTSPDELTESNPKRGSFTIENGLNQSSVDISSVENKEHEDIIDGAAETKNSDLNVPKNETDLHTITESDEIDDLDIRDDTKF